MYYGVMSNTLTKEKLEKIVSWHGWFWLFHRIDIPAVYKLTSKSSEGYPLSLGIELVNFPEELRGVIQHHDTITEENMHLFGDVTCLSPETYAAICYSLDHVNQLEARLKRF